ncbi:hypothetical protein Taro_001530 [Colocasia esculenta]|uniref:BED-type domain-containing protein n=1 Tax=Colocasia esculenta TaxID=4460 RepID=A0A843TKZ8_COLES|nr:hypothetical protein [Colocasia esculenta]
MSVGVGERKGVESEQSGGRASHALVGVTGGRDDLAGGCGLPLHSFTRCFQARSWGSFAMVEREMEAGAGVQWIHGAKRRHRGGQKMTQQDQVMAAEGGAAPAPHSSSNPPSANSAWAHGIVVDMARRKVQCKYCNRVLSGGVFHLKQHLAGIKGEVAPCSRVSAEVRMQFCQYMKEKETSKGNTSRRRQEIREELSAPPRRSMDLPRERQFFDLDEDEEGHFFNPQYMYRTDGRRENYDNSSEVLIGAKNVIKRMLDNENRAIIACKQMHDYRLQIYHFGTSTAQRAAQILSPGELDDVPLLPEFETPPAPKRQKKTVGARGRSTKHGISIADLETTEEDIDDETPEPNF